MRLGGRHLCGSIFGARETLWAFRCLRLQMLVQTQGKILLKGFQDESHDWLRDSQGALRYSTYSKFRWNPSMSTWLKLLDVRYSLKIMHPGSLDFLLVIFLIFSTILNYHIYYFSGTIREIFSTRKIWFRNSWTRWRWLFLPLGLDTDQRILLQNYRFLLWLENTFRAVGGIFPLLTFFMHFEA